MLLFLQLALPANRCPLKRPKCSYVTGSSRPLMPPSPKRHEHSVWSARTGRSLQAALALLRRADLRRLLDASIMKWNNRAAALSRAVFKVLFIRPSFETSTGSSFRGKAATRAHKVSQLHTWYLSVTSASQIHRSPPRTQPWPFFMRGKAILINSAS